MTIREIALSLLDEYEIGGKYVNLSLKSHLTDGLVKEERAFLTVLVYTAVERKLTYDYYVSSISKRGSKDIDVHTLNILRLGMAQLLHVKSVPAYAAVNETVKLGRHKGERAFVNGVLRAAVRLIERDELPLPEREKNLPRYLSVLYSFPLKTVKHFVSLIGEGETEKLLAAFNESSYTDITVNTRKISREELSSGLLQYGINSSLSDRSMYSMRVSGSFNPEKIDEFRKGLFFVQDEICSVAIDALELREGDSVVDVCSAPGGKSFASAIRVGDGGSVLALDLHESKLSLIESGAMRLGLNNIKVFERDAREPDEALYSAFDRVICDVPCSGLGVMGKKPDIRYKSLDDCSELPELQKIILAESSKYLKTGGILVYSTCTLNPDENERVVEEFLKNHPEFEAEDFALGDIVSERGMFTAYPHRHFTDGFFISKLRKIR